MKKACLILCAVVLAAITLTLNMTAADPAEKKILRHVVNFKFKATASEAQIKEVVDAFRALQTKIPEIRAFEWGTNNSPEKHDKGFTHCFILTFHSEKDREIYLPHPDHKAFGSKLGPILEDVFVIDYWAQQ